MPYPWPTRSVHNRPSLNQDPGKEQVRKQKEKWERGATAAKTRKESLDPFLPTSSVRLTRSLQVFLFLQLLKHFQHLLLELKGGMQRFFFKTKATINLSFIVLLSQDTWLLRPGRSVPLLLTRLSLTWKGRVFLSSSFTIRAHSLLYLPALGPGSTSEPHLRHSVYVSLCSCCDLNTKHLLFSE